MTDLVITTCTPVKVIEQFTGPAAEAIAVGEYVRFNTTSGAIEPGNATAAGEARSGGIAIKAALQAGDTISFVRKGWLDVGNALSALTYDDDVFLSDTDGTLADAAGTVTKIVGTVVPGFAVTTTYDKLLRVDL